MVTSASLFFYCSFRSTQGAKMSSTMEWIFISTTVLSTGISVMLYIFLQRQVRELRDGNQKLRLALSKKKYALKTKNLDLAFMGRGWQLNSKQIELKCKIAEGSTGIVWVSSFFFTRKKMRCS